MDAAARREARKQWRGHVFRSWAEAERFDTEFWSAIPLHERARVTWELSEELFRLARPDEPYEPRLSRSTARITRR
jgi:hypothetical protein